MGYSVEEQELTDSNGKLDDTKPLGLRIVKLDETDDNWRWIRRDWELRHRMLGEADNSTSHVGECTLSLRRPYKRLGASFREYLEKATQKEREVPVGAAAAENPKSTEEYWNNLPSHQQNEWRQKFEDLSKAGVIAKSADDLLFEQLEQVDKIRFKTYSQGPVTPASRQIIADIPEGEREKACARVLPFTRSIFNLDEKGNRERPFDKLGEEGTKDNIKTFREAIATPQDDYKAFYRLVFPTILKADELIPEDRQEEFYRNIFPSILGKGIPCLMCKVDGIFDTLANVPAADRIDVFVNTLTYLKETVGLKPRDETVYHNEKDDRSRVCDITRLIANLPAADRPKVCEPAGSFLQNHCDRNTCREALGVMKRAVSISPDDLANVFEHSIPFLEGKINYSDFHSFWEFICKEIAETPIAKRADVCSRVNLLIHKMGPVSNHLMGELSTVKSILRAARDRSPADLEEICARTLSFFQKLGLDNSGGVKWYVVDWIFRAARNISPENWEEFCTQTQLFLTDIKADKDNEENVGNEEDVLAWILSRAGEITSTDWKAFFARILNVCPNAQGMKYDKLTSIFDAILSIPRGNLETYDKIVMPLLVSIGDTEKKVNIAKALRFFPLTQLLEANLLEQMIRKISNEPIPERLSAERKIIKFLLMEIPALVPILHQHLQGELQAHPEKPSVHELAKTIYHSLTDETGVNEFLLFEEHPLYQEALNVMILAEGDRSNPKNAFTIYEKLLAFAKEPPPAIRLPIKEMGGGHQFVLNLETVSSRPEFVIPKEILPAGVNTQAFLDLFKNLNTRLESIKASGGDLYQRTKSSIGDLNTSQFNVDLPVDKRFEGSFSMLKKFAENPDILRWLALIPGLKDGDRVPKETACLCAIIRFILDQRDTLEAGELVSPREEALFKISASIQGCTQGTGEGVTIAYNWLEGKYHYKVTTEPDIPIVEKVKLEMVYPVIEKAVLDLISGDTPAMKELTGEHINIRQLAHQSQYVKGAIGRFIGLPGKPKFDPHTHVLYDSLVDKNLEQMLTIFYKHFSIDLLADALSKHGIILLEHPPVFNGIISLLGGCGFSKDPSDRWEEEKVDYEEMPTTYHLTKEAAFALLGALGFVKEVHPLPPIEEEKSEGEFKDNG